MKLTSPPEDLAVLIIALGDGLQMRRYIEPEAKPEDLFRLAWGLVFRPTLDPDEHSPDHDPSEFSDEGEKFEMSREVQYAPAPKKVARELAFRSPPGQTQPPTRPAYLLLTRSIVISSGISCTRHCAMMGRSSLESGGSVRSENAAGASSRNGTMWAVAERFAKAGAYRAAVAKF